MHLPRRQRRKGYWFSASQFLVTLRSVGQAERGNQGPALEPTVQVVEPLNLLFGPPDLLASLGYKGPQQIFQHCGEPFSHLWCVLIQAYMLVITSTSLPQVFAQGIFTTITTTLAQNLLDRPLKNWRYHGKHPVNGCVEKSHRQWR